MEEGLTTDTAVSAEADSSDKDEERRVESGIQSSDEEVVEPADSEKVSFK